MNSTLSVEAMQLDPEVSPAPHTPVTEVPSSQVYQLFSPLTDPWGRKAIPGGFSSW